MDKRRIKQKILGALLLVISTLSVIALKDATAAVLLTPLGGYALVTKADILIHTDKECGGDV